jgi:hypothetical protein
LAGWYHLGVPPLGLVSSKFSDFKNSFISDRSNEETEISLLSEDLWIASNMSPVTKQLIPLVSFFCIVGLLNSSYGFLICSHNFAETEESLFLEKEGVTK